MVEGFHELRYTLPSRGHNELFGTDRGFAPDLDSKESAGGTLVAASKAAGYEPGWDVLVGLDAAANQLRVEGGYALAHERRQLSSRDLAAYNGELTDRYPLLLLEDGLSEDDWHGWQKLTKRLGQRLEPARDEYLHPATSGFGRE